jgi:T5SS/PEP-CTERM-associated repeat protein
MTISNLIMSAPDGLTNTLLLDNAGAAVPLRVLDFVSLGSGSELVVTNSALRVEGVSGMASFSVDGTIRLLGGSDGVVTNSSLVIGSSGDGGLLLARETVIGEADDSHGTLTVVSGTNAITSFLFIGNAAGATGKVWLTGGELVVTNDVTRIGEWGVGALTISNGLWRAAEVDVANLGTARGTLTMGGGTSEVGGAMFVAFFPGATGTVWLTGGSLVVTNDRIVVAREGNGQMTIGAGAVVDAKGSAVGEVLGSEGTLTVDGGQLTIAEVLQLGLAGRGWMIVSNGLADVNGLNVGQVNGSAGVLNLAGGEMRLGNQGLLVAAEDAATGSVWMTGGQLFSSNSHIYVGIAGVGSMTVSNGQIDTQGFIFGQLPGAIGTLTVAGGTINAIGSWLSIGNSEGATGTVWIAGGQLSMPNPQQYVGDWGVGRMTVSNGTVIAQSMIVGLHTNSQGWLTIAGGTMTMPSFLAMGWETNAVGQLSVGAGWLTCGNLYAGYYGAGTITINGGTVNPSGLLSVGRYSTGTGTVWVTGGVLTVTNYTADTRIGRDGGGQLTISNGTVSMPALSIGFSVGACGSLTVPGGTTTVWSNLTIGVAGCGATGVVTVAGGDLFVTNANGSATLEVRSGTLTLSRGLLQVDRFVMTNACAHFVRTGGGLSYNSAVLDPARDDDHDGIANGWEQAYGLNPLDAADAGRDPDGDGFPNFQEYNAGTDPTNSASVFRITGLKAEGNDIRVTWSTVTNRSYYVWAGVVGRGGSYSNAINPVPISFLIAGTPTNTSWLDLGGATNQPSRYYRISAVPP